MVQDAQEMLGVIDESGASYGRGTLIDTPLGERAVEDLRLGEAVLSMQGEALTIKSIGGRSYRAWQLLHNHEVAPVCVRANAVADHVPKRDLWVSPRHAIYLDDMLIPAGLLVNGSSIVRHDDIWEIHYFFIELERHAVILAENAPAETRIPSRQGVLSCAPRAEDGQRVAAIRQRLAQRACALRLSDAPCIVRP